MQIWFETFIGIGCPNFLTGIGGFLQSLIFGYGGIRIKSAHLDIYPILPQDVTQLNYTGLNYMGNSFNLHIQKVNSKDSFVMITVTSKLPLSPVLKLHLVEDPIQTFQLGIGKTVQYHNRKAFLSSK